MSDFFFVIPDPLEDKIVCMSFRVEGRSFCASPSCRPGLRLGLQLRSLAQKDYS
jgi:hypothetical protein